MKTKTTNDDLQKALAKEIKKRHDTACALYENFYTDPITGLMVSTRFQHLTRGACCDSGCRHCPYREQPTRPQDDQDDQDQS